MMKSADSKHGIYRERRKAESSAIPLNRAFPFGADRANAKEQVTRYGAAPLQADQSVGFEPKIRVVPRCA